MKAPWWINTLAVLTAIIMAIFAKAQIFPDPAIAEIKADLSIHSVLPAHGIKELKIDFQRVEATQQVLVDDVGELEQGIRGLSIELKTTNELLYEISGKLQ